MRSDIGIYGLGVMGENLAMNMERNGYRVSVCNYRGENVEAFAQGRGRGHRFLCLEDERDFINSLSRPRIIFLMIKAGRPVDDTFERLSVMLSAGDIFIDGGNSEFSDTCRRVKQAEKLGIYYVGSGVSGGELGALNGPSLMPGGNKEAWPVIEPIFTAIAAKAKEDGKPCAAWMGRSGAGHLVKTVHNGIEYGDMQLICEGYDMMRKICGADAAQMSRTFQKWGEGKLAGYLVDITADILATLDSDGLPLVDKIADKAMQKGTGKWASVLALNENVPLTVITEAVYARILSSRRRERTAVSNKLLSIGTVRVTWERLCELLEKALYAAKIISYAQGFDLINAVSAQYNLGVSLGEVARVWRNGCIIRSGFLGKIAEAYDLNPSLSNLVQDAYFSEELNSVIPDLREVVSFGVLSGVPLPVLSSALSFYDGYHCHNLPANLLQAQRDYFGAHMFERTDRPEGELYHYNWTGKGGATHASFYEA